MINARTMTMTKNGGAGALVSLLSVGSDMTMTMMSDGYLSNGFQLVIAVIGSNLSR
jgi:hypothetical protein